MGRSQEYYRHHTDRVTENRNKLWNHYVDKYEYLVDVSDTRFDKKHPFDCGRAGCKMCHPHYNEKRRFTLQQDELENLLKEYDLEL